jgi:hypothetical protein
VLQLIKGLKYVLLSDNMEGKTKIIHSFDGASRRQGGGNFGFSKDKIMKSKTPLILFIILGLLGIATGYVFAQAIGGGSVQVAGPNGQVTTTSVTKGQIYGSKDEKTFKDSAEGVLKKGGIDGEGAYHLERPGGDSQNVYLTSSVVDLSPFIGKKVKVWGETNAAQKAGWLMDVGRLQIL